MLLGGSRWGPQRHQLCNRGSRGAEHASVTRRIGSISHVHCKRRRLHVSGNEQAETQKSREEQLEKLQAALRAAISEEDYQGAAGLRDEIQQLEGEDPVKALQAELQKAVAEQNYTEAIRCRDELEKLVPKPKPRIPESPPPPTMSDTVTEGVRVQIKSSFLPHRSRPGQYFFMYQVRIQNQLPDTTVRLFSRHFHIEDANGFQTEVRGEGVLGKQPELGPQEQHTYTSFVPMRTPTGKMKGSYQMQVKDSEGEWKEAFDASIGIFGLSMSDSTPL